VARRLYSRVRFALPRGAERAELVRILRRSPEEAAPGLLGQVLLRRLGRRVVAARIVETEAYLGADDPAAHAYRGRTRRTEPLFGPPGTLYVYFVYGIHHCLNLAVDAEGVPGCVLIRAAEPLPGAGLAPRALSGPARLCRVLRLDTRHSGRHLFEGTAGLTLRRGEAPRRVVTGPRVGIRRATQRALRFWDPGSTAVSK